MYRDDLLIINRSGLKTNLYYYKPCKSNNINLKHQPLHRLCTSYIVQTEIKHPCFLFTATDLIENTQKHYKI